MFHSVQQDKHPNYRQCHGNSSAHHCRIVAVWSRRLSRSHSSIRMFCDNRHKFVCKSPLHSARLRSQWILAKNSWRWRYLRQHLQNMPKSMITTVDIFFKFLETYFDPPTKRTPAHQHWLPSIVLGMRLLLQNFDRWIAGDTHSIAHDNRRSHANAVSYKTIVLRYMSLMRVPEYLCNTQW